MAIQARSLDVNSKSSGKLSVLEYMAYGCGDYASNIIYSAMATFLLFYYTDVIGVNAAAVGSIMLVSRLLDGVSDLIMGVLIDRTKSKYGKARPWLLRMSIPYFIGSVLLFSVPIDWSEKGKLAYIFLTYNFAFTGVFTAINLPYATMNSLMTQDQYERSVLTIYRMIFATVGTLSISTLTLPVVKFFGNDARAWTYTFIVFGIVAVVFFLLTFLGCKERVGSHLDESNRNSKPIPLAQGLKALTKNKYWLIMTGVLLLAYITMAINGGATVYYAKTLLNDEGLVSQLTWATSFTQIIAMLVVARFIKKYGKRNVLITGCIISIIGFLMIVVMPSNINLVIIGNIIRGIGGAGTASCMFAMVSDTIEYGEWKTGLRTEGLVNSAASFGQKVGNGLGTAIVGWVLAICGYVGGVAVQSESAIFAIKALYIYVPIILTVIEIIILFAYKLDKEYPSILEELKQRKLDAN